MINEERSSAGQYAESASMETQENTAVLWGSFSQFLLLGPGGAALDKMETIDIVDKTNTLGPRIIIARRPR